MFSSAREGSVIRLTLRSEERKARAELANRHKGLEWRKRQNKYRGGPNWVVPHPSTIS